MATEGPPNPKSGIAGLVAALLAYIDRPWKVAAVLVLGLVGGVGWIAYERRDVILEAWLTPAEVTLQTAEIPAALEKLIVETSADLVQIWQVDLAQNAQWFVAARLHDGERPVIPTPRRLPIIVTVSDVEILVSVLAGHPMCVPVTDKGSPLARRLAGRGMTRGCAIPVPPSPDAFVGIIYLAWRDPPETGAENVAVGAAREIALKLTRR